MSHVRGSDRPEALPNVGSAALAYRASSASSGGALGSARRRPLMATSEAEYGPMRILVVEPDSRTRSLLEVGLSRAGFHVVTARTVVEAKHHVGLGRPLPAMVVCETDLLGEDGFKFCAQLRADLRTAALPIVLLSQRPQAFNVEMASSAGADDYLPKPVFLNDVISLARLKAGQSAAQSIYPADAEVLPIAELLRALLAGMRSGHLWMDDGSAALVFEQGRVIDARFEAQRGERALSRVLSLCRGPYALKMGPSLLAGEMQPVDLRELCQSYLPNAVRWREAAPRPSELSSVLQINFPGLLAALSGLPDGLNALVRLFDGRRSVRDIVLESDLAEATTLLATRRLAQMGVLESARPSPQRELPAPPMFEPTANPVEAFSMGAALDDLDSRLERALMDAAAAAAQSAAAPPRIAEVTYFPKGTPRPPRAAKAEVAAQPDLAPQLELATWPMPSARPPERRSRWTATVAALGFLAVSAAVAWGASLPQDPVEVLPAWANTGKSAGVPDWRSPSAATSPDGLVQLGLARYGAGDLDGARAAAEQALALDPSNEQALMLLVAVSIDRGQADEASGLLRRYLQGRRGAPSADPNP